MIMVADKVRDLLYTIFCFALVFFIAWPVAFSLAAIYVLFVPFAAWIPPLEMRLDDILGALKLPLTWTKRAIHFITGTGENHTAPLRRPTLMEEEHMLQMGESAMTLDRMIGNDP
ncbi:hypothetical protein ECG_03518 [Echinococcus granulosus]|nr:hypothetical protein ECG_03518 [Echinococcus granulosus]CDS23535.1 hypothetical protein EgrG_002042100 [Echinococcus granulosus]